jgi:hypothetical protein
MYRSTSNVLITVGMPVAFLLLTVFGIQTTSLVSQLLFSLAGVVFFFTALLFLPYFFEHHSKMHGVYSRYDAMQLAGRIRVQRTQHYTLNHALARHQLRGRNQWAEVRS